MRQLQISNLISLLPQKATLEVVQEFCLVHNTNHETMISLAENVNRFDISAAIFELRGDQFYYSEGKKTIDSDAFREWGVAENTYREKGMLDRADGVAEKLSLALAQLDEAGNKQETHLYDFGCFLRARAQLEMNPRARRPVPQPTNFVAAFFPEVPRTAPVKVAVPVPQTFFAAAATAPRTETMNPMAPELPESKTESAATAQQRSYRHNPYANPFGQTL